MALTGQENMIRNSDELSTTPKSKSKILAKRLTPLKNTSSPKKPLGTSNSVNINRSTPTKLYFAPPKTPIKPKPNPSPNTSDFDTYINNDLHMLDTPSSDSEYFSSPGRTFGTNGTGTVDGSINANTSSCKKRLRSSVLSSQSIPPVSRRNARERNRVKQVSLAFNLLRQHIPQANRKKKLSKVETLRCALDYIQCLRDMLAKPSEPCDTQYPVQDTGYYNNEILYTIADKSIEYQTPIQNVSFPTENQVPLDQQVLSLPKHENAYHTLFYSSVFPTPTNQKSYDVQMLPAEAIIDTTGIPIKQSVNEIKSENDLELFDDLEWLQNTQ